MSDRKSSKTFVLTRGNGAQHAIVIQGAGRCLDLEALACGADGKSRHSLWMNGILPTLWCTLLLTVCGLKEGTWFLLAVGAVGMTHTVWVAGTPREPGVYGIHLDYKDVVCQPKVMQTLMEAEARYPGLGRAMLPTFFPGKLHPHEDAWWQKAWITEQKVRGKAHALPTAVQCQQDDTSCSCMPCSWHN